MSLQIKICRIRYVRTRALGIFFLYLSAKSLASRIQTAVVRLIDLSDYHYKTVPHFTPDNTFSFIVLSVRYSLGTKTDNASL